MEFLWILISLIAILFLLTVAYKVIPPRAIGREKPFISFFPKYKTAVRLAVAILDASDPVSALTDRLGEWGFKQQKSTKEWMVFSRGHILGDFSVKIAKVDIKVGLPLSENVPLIVEAGWIAGFDTGDLWLFTSEIKEKLSR